MLNNSYSTGNVDGNDLCRYRPWSSSKLFAVPSGAPLVMTTNGNGWCSSHCVPTNADGATTTSTVCSHGFLPGFLQCCADRRALKYDGDALAVAVAESTEGVTDGLSFRIKLRVSEECLLWPCSNLAPTP